MAHSTAERKVQREEEFKRWRMAGEEVWQERKSSSKGRYSARKVQCEEGFESWKVSGEEDCGRGGLRERRIAGEWQRRYREVEQQEASNKK